MVGTGQIVDASLQPAWRDGMTLELLDNIVWHSLAGPHAMYSSGTATARRYAKGFSPIIGFADANRPDFAALAEYCDPDERFYCGGWAGPAPAGWEIHTDTAGHQMVWNGDVPAHDDALDEIRLGLRDSAQMQALVAIAPPGPFAARTVELGEYYGVFDDGRLVAMAGERMAAGTLREISGVCTHPDFQGRGLARRLMHRLIRLQLQRGQTPFLHVMRDNAHARQLYERMGFRLHQERPLRVVSRAP
jgi:ribosomal protein S18 acetylase RimI-like enzyme